MAGICISAQCASTTGSAKLLSVPRSAEPTACIRLTNSHNHEETCAESSKIDHSVGRVAHKIIRIGAFSTYPIRKWCNHIGCNDKEGEEIVEEGCAQDNEEEADRQDLEEYQF